MAFIDANRADLGVEPICTVLRSAGLRVAPSTYYAAKNRTHCARAVRDALMTPILVELWEANYRVYGARKLAKAARRAGHHVGRDQVARLMKAAGITGVHRRRKVRTTKADPEAPRHPDLVKRDFTAVAPDQLWVTDLTYVPTWAGVAYVCFITDAFSRMIVGWRVASHMRTTMVLDAIEMARWSRETRCRACDVILMPGRSSPVFAMVNVSLRSARCPPSAPSVTATTMPWLRRSTATTRPS